MPNKVSVIIPCYNQGRYLDDALASIFKQTYQYWECIIVDDGSVDETKEKALQWQNKDSRYKYVYKENGGLSSARNYGLSFCTGQYVQFLDADDIITSQKLEIQIDSLNRYPGYDISVCDYMPSDEFDLTKPFFDGRYLKPFFSGKDPLQCLIAEWEVSLSIPCHCYLFRSSFFLDQKIRFDEKLPNHEDWDCWMQVFTSKPSVTEIPERLAIYRIRNTAMSYNRIRMTNGFLKAIKKQIRLLGGEKKYLESLIRKYYLVLSDYRCDNRLDYYRLQSAKEYKQIKKKISAFLGFLKTKKSL